MRRSRFIHPRNVTYSACGSTWLEHEEAAYPHGGQTRRGRALFADGKIRSVRAGVPDTFFSIPAHARIKGKYVRGFLTMSDKHDGQWFFHKYNKEAPDAEDR